MVRNYSKKTNRCDLDEGDIKKALDDITAGKYSCRQASVIYHINMTLLYRLKKFKVQIRMQKKKAKNIINCIVYCY